MTTESGTATSSDPRPLTILVFGQSNATGEHLADPSVAWPKLVATDLGARLGRPTTVHVRPIYVHGGSVGRYLDRELEKFDPDVVIFGASAFAFAQKMVGNRIRRRWGERPANWYHAVERRVDSRTRHSEAGSKANRFARRLLIKVIGADPTASYEAVVEGTTMVFRGLAQKEVLTIVLMQMNPVLAVVNDRETRDLLDRFDIEVRDAATRYHAPMIECRPALEAAPDQRALLFPDRLHYTAYGHRVIADAVLDSLSKGDIELPG